MTLFDKIGHYVRIASGMHQYLRAPMPNDWDALTRRQLEQREKRWLETLARAVFARRDHPYHQMFRSAGCSYEDLVEAVGREGLEPTLARLRGEGVYLTHDEFKGKKSIVRSGRHIRSGANSFANPLAEGWLETTSGGSRSKGTKTRTSTAHRIHCEAYYALNIREFGLQEYAQIQVKPILPAGAGIGCCVSYTRLGCRVERWFATLTAKQLRRGTHRSTVQLETAIKNYIEICNEDPKPFVWTKTADQILDSIARFCMRTSGTGH